MSVNIRLPHYAALNINIHEKLYRKKLLRLRKILFKYLRPFLLCYQFTAICASKGDISASAIIVGSFFEFIIIYVGPSRLFLRLRLPFL